MRTIHATLLARLALLLALATPGFASESIKLKNGRVLNGRATAYDADKKVLSFRTDDGQDQTYTLDQLDQRSVYMVNTSLIAQDNAKGQLQLANYARDIGLYAHAARRYGYAETADPSLKDEIEKQRVTLRKMAADYCMKNAQDMIAKNDIKGAEEWLTTMVQKLPDEPQTEQARALLEQHYTQERNARDDKLEQEHADLLQGDLKKGKEFYDRMITRTKEGLTAKNSGTAVSTWKSALGDGKGVLKEIDRLAKKYASDAKVQDGAAKYRKLTTDQMVDLHLHLASSYTTSSSYKDALKETNAALALDPGNQNALAQRARIEQASSEGVGIGRFGRF